MSIELLVQYRDDGAMGATSRDGVTRNRTREDLGSLRVAQRIFWDLNLMLGLETYLFRVSQKRNLTGEVEVVAVAYRTYMCFGFF